ncbi:MAG: hypothetical protein AAF687_11180 [Pseudomonadota bacterium]
MLAMNSIRLRGAALLGGLSLMLTGCFISPGKFESELRLLANDEFTFTYKGEVYFLGLAQLAEMQQQRSTPSFTAFCYGDGESSGDSAADAAEAVADMAEEAANATAEAAADAAEAVEAYEDMPADEAVEPVAEETVPAPPPIVTVAAVPPRSSYGRRDCTPEEEAEQRAKWEERQAERRARDKEQAQQFSSLLGGIDPTDPNAEEELAKIISRQKGFDKVVAKGNGLFEISYSIRGSLSHDFMFPMIEDTPTSSPFVQMFNRDGDMVRINAPGFAPQSSTSPWLALMLGNSAFGGGSSRTEEAFKNTPKVEGKFTILTTGRILANNTDDGPASTRGGQLLTWQINARSKAPPTALIAKPGS